ncbi:MAG: hypothetical protein LUH63_22500 [Parabacteroides sp.]|nr:hypothetical protein [Parabacteroides sp.]
MSTRSYPASRNGNLPGTAILAASNSSCVRRDLCADTPPPIDCYLSPIATFATTDKGAC